MVWAKFRLNVSGAGSKLLPLEPEDSIMARGHLASNTPCRVRAHPSSSEHYAFLSQSSIAVAHLMVFRGEVSNVKCGLSQAQYL